VLLAQVKTVAQGIRSSLFYYTVLLPLLGIQCPQRYELLIFRNRSQHLGTEVFDQLSRAFDGFDSSDVVDSVEKQIVPPSENGRNSVLVVLLKVVIDLFLHLLQAGLDFRNVVVGLVSMTYFIHPY
jgi:hypothetical protein